MPYVTYVCECGRKQQRWHTARKCVSCGRRLYRPLEKKLKAHVREALDFAARLPCHKSNCGSVCLCGSCHARRALALMRQLERK